MNFSESIEGEGAEKDHFDNETARTFNTASSTAIYEHSKKRPIEQTYPDEWGDSVRKAVEVWHLGNDEIEDAVIELMSVDMEGLTEIGEIIDFLIVPIDHPITKQTLDQVIDFASFLLCEAKVEGYSIFECGEVIQDHISLAISTKFDGEISNFPSNSTQMSQFYSELVYEIGKICIPNEVSQLNESDIEKANNTLQKGDVVLVGSLGHLSAKAIGGAVTHALIFVGKNTFIHSVGNGVELIHADEVFSRYDTMMIVRAENEYANSAVSYAYSQLGKPYDFNFNDESDAFYCTELVAASFRAAGKSDVPKPVESKRGFSQFMNVVAIHPEDFINNGFQPVFHSHNLIQTADGEVSIYEQKS